MDVQSVKLSPRSVIGKKVKALRRQGTVPVHMYGAGIDSLPLQTDASLLRRLLLQKQVVGTSLGSKIGVTLSDRLDRTNSTIL